MTKKSSSSPVLRGLLLRILYAAHPEYFTLLEIQQGLDDLRFTASQESILSELDYLHYRIPDKPLAVIQTLAVGGSDEKIVSAKLTAFGVDLVEKRMSVPDPEQNWIKL